MITSKFHLPYFKTSQPNGKLYIYYTGTSDPAPAFEDSSGLLSHPSPIILDEDGACILYIEKDTTYRFVLFDEDDNLIYDLNDIKQNFGEPGDPDGPIGPQGKVGKRGNQGISGAQGAVGFKGEKGEKGFNFYNKIPINVNQSITVPNSVREVFITGCGGGGASADWSPYMFFGYLSNNYQRSTLDNFKINITAINADDSEDFYETEINTPKKVSYCVAAMSPGSGFSGKSVYRYKIDMDSNQNNVLTFIIGKGGQPSSNDSLNGNDGEATLVYLNNRLVLTLDGGFGGENNFFPGGQEFNIDPNKYVFKQNFGFNKYSLYSETAGTTTGDENSAVEFYNNYEDNPIELSQQIFSFYETDTILYSVFADICAAPLYDFIGSFNIGFYKPFEPEFDYDLFFNFLPSNHGENQPYQGGKNIFGNNYFNYKNTQLTTKSIKNYTKYSGYGAGGDIWNFYAPESVFQFQIDSTIPTTTQKIIFLNKELSIKMTQDILANFNPVGIVGGPGIYYPETDDLQWSVIDNLKERLISEGHNVIENSGLTTSFSILDQYGRSSANNTEFKGSAGVDGFVLLEFGGITDNTA